MVFINFFRIGARLERVNLYSWKLKAVCIFRAIQSSRKKHLNPFSPETLATCLGTNVVAVTIPQRLSFPPTSFAWPKSRRPSLDCRVLSRVNDHYQRGTYHVAPLVMMRAFDSVQKKALTSANEPILLPSELVE